MGATPMANTQINAFIYLHVVYVAEQVELTSGRKPGRQVFSLRGPIIRPASLGAAAVIVQEPLIGLIKWLRPKGLKVRSYVEKYDKFKNQTLKKSAGTQKSYAQRNTPEVGNFSY